MRNNRYRKSETGKEVAPACLSAAKQMLLQQSDRKRCKRAVACQICCQEPLQQSIEARLEASSYQRLSTRGSATRIDCNRSGASSAFTQGRGWFRAECDDDASSKQQGQQGNESDLLRQKKRANAGSMLPRPGRIETGRTTEASPATCPQLEAR